MTEARIIELKNIANKIRIGIIDSTHAAKCGHPGGSLSIADIMACLYFEKMNIDPKIPRRREGTGSCFPRDTLRPRSIQRLRTEVFSPWKIL